MKKAIALISIFLGVVLSPLIVQAEFPSGCAELQQCVDSGLSSLLSSCLGSNPTCDLTKFSGNQTVDRFGTSSGEIADRAIEIAGCSNKTTRLACNLCYQAAKVPLRDRFFGRVFHGMLANAIQLIETERLAICLQLPKSNKS